jgi:NADH-quinone oxidoreductase subunit M
MLSGLLILFPIAGSVAVMFTRKEAAIKRSALIIAVTELIFVLIALAGFKHVTGPQFIFSFQWLKGLNIPFSFGMDGLSLVLVLLTAVLIPVIILASYSCRSGRSNIFFGLILIAESGLIGVFTALNGLIFYIFWEFALIPVYFLIALWGGENRIKITFKFLVYTLTGSLMMLAALIYLYFQTPAPHSFSFDALYHAVTTGGAQLWVLAAFMLAFAIKIPLVPFHTWQSDTYATAPPAGSMILSGIMLKMGLYGILRLLIPVTPLALKIAGPVVITAITAGIIYASVIAIKQDDLKRFIAWVSIAHVSLIAAALLSLNRTAAQGAIFQMISHGISVVGLFVVADILETRFKTRKISELGAVAGEMPLLSILFIIIVLGSVALPLTSGFVGEFLMLLGLFAFNPWISAVAGLTVIFSAVYMLRMYQRVMLGTVAREKNFKQPPLLRNELIVLVTLAALIILLGCFPKVLLDLASAPAETIIPSVSNILN